MNLLACERRNAYRLHAERWRSWFTGTSYGDEISALTEQRERSILLPGDAEKQVEYQILHENEPTFLHADALNGEHHVSRNSTMRESLGAVAPQISANSQVKKTRTATQPRASGTVGRERNTDLQIRPGWGGANPNGWLRATGELFCGCSAGAPELA